MDGKEEDMCRNKVLEQLRGHGIQCPKGRVGLEQKSRQMQMQMTWSVWRLTDAEVL